MGHAERIKRQELIRRRAQMEGSFAKLVATGEAQAMPFDRFGVPIRVGDEILFRPPFDFVFKVEAIQPILDPRAPVGLITMVLVSAGPIHVQAGQPLMNAVIVATAETQETQQAAEQALPDPDPTEPPVDDGTPRIVLAS